MRIFTVLALAVSAEVAAASLELSCPAEIETKQEIVTPPSGWRISKSSPTVLDQGTTTSKHHGEVTGFSSGPPEERAILAPDRTIKSKKERSFINVWPFSTSEENWFICSYRNSVIELSKPLPAGLKQCSIQYNNAQMVARAWCD
ncbi:hypothetical protein CSQ89_03155 [Chitinimonas sp. BJB300]|nr:hypothetical protein CSQ89_03155 [Chitinimonas sp. BJB300]